MPVEPYTRAIKNFESAIDALKSVRQSHPKFQQAVAAQPRVKALLDWMKDPKLPKEGSATELSPQEVTQLRDLVRYVSLFIPQVDSPEIESPPVEEPPA